jgi:hypothetical protein
MPTTTARTRTRTPAQPILLRRPSDGSVLALSSDGTTVYTLRTGSEVTCEWKDFSYNGRCRNVAAATAR